MLSQAVAALNAPLFTLGGVPTSSAEVLGFVTGAVCVWLVAKQHVLSWPIGIANNALFILLFATAGLYADTGLQVVYIALAAYGWWAWLHGAGGGELRVTRAGAREFGLVLGAGVLATALLTGLLDVYTDSSVPFWDALTTGLSLVATYFQCRKQVETWVFWIAADVIYVPLYASKGLYLTGFLYLGFIALCVVGLREWRKSLADEAPAAAVVAA